MSLNLSCEEAKCTVRCPTCNTEHEVSLNISIDRHYSDAEGFPCVNSETITCTNCEYVFRIHPIEVAITVKAETETCSRTRHRYNIGRVMVHRRTGTLYKIADIQPFTNKGYIYTLTPTLEVLSEEVKAVDYLEKGKTYINDFMALDFDT